MPPLTLLRKKLGLSQRQLAAFAGIDRTHLTRVEGGSRLIGNKPLIPLMLLHEAAPDGEEKTLKRREDRREENRQEALFHRQRQQYLQRQLQRFETGLQQASNLAQCVMKMETTSLHLLSPTQQRQLAEWKFLAEKQAANFSPDKQQKLRLEIHLAGAKAEFFEKELMVDGS